MKFGYSQVQLVPDVIVVLSGHQLHGLHGERTIDIEEDTYGIKQGTLENSDNHQRRYTHICQARSPPKSNPASKPNQPENQQVEQTAERQATRERA